LNCWTRDYWLFGGTVEVVTTLAHCPPSTKLTSLDKLASSLSLSTTSSDVSLGLNNRGLLLLELIIATTHTNCEMLTGKKKSSVCNTARKHSPKSKKQNAISRALNGGPSKEKDER
jgi:hypothetical protein